MATYTTYFNLLKPDPTDLVDINSQINRNLDILDKPFQGLFGWLQSGASSITASELDRLPFYKYHKTYSSSLWYVGPDKVVHQDTSVTVNSWGEMESYLISGYNSIPGDPLRQRIIGNTSTGSALFEISGSIRLNNWDQIPLNTTIVVGNLPSFMIPNRSWYFMQYAGEIAGAYSSSRVFIGSSGNIQIVKYGTNPAAGSVQNKIPFGGIRYFMDTPNTP